MLYVFQFQALYAFGYASHTWILIDKIFQVPQTTIYNLASHYFLEIPNKSSNKN